MWNREFSDNIAEKEVRVGGSNMVRKNLVFVLLFSFMMNVGVISSAAENNDAEDTNTNNHDWKLTWEDNFEGTELNTDNWSVDTGNGFYDAEDNWVEGWGNEELQSYQEDNVIVDNGTLVLEGREETVSDEKGTFDFTSGKIQSQGKFSQKYGKFEAKLALPEGQGYWPALWMMPEEDVYGNWAASGEIDIMEAAGGRPNHIGGAIHYGGEWPNNKYTAKDYDFSEGKGITDYNVYSVEWEPGEIRWYVNEELFQTANDWSSTNEDGSVEHNYPAPFDQEFHLILNLAIGGWYDGDPTESTVFPGQVKVDYVRAYELASEDPANQNDGEEAGTTVLSAFNPFAVGISLLLIAGILGATVYFKRKKV